VRFGKLQLLRSHEKAVTLFVNDKELDVKMKLGRAGEAYFVQEETDAGEEDEAASPLSSPRSSSPAAAPDAYEELLCLLLNRLLQDGAKGQAEGIWRWVLCRSRPSRVCPLAGHTVSALLLRRTYCGCYRASYSTHAQGL
jgi:hypothetical protein